MYKPTRLTAVLLCFVILLTAAPSCGQGGQEIYDIIFWHSYAGSQAEILDNLVNTYNETEGAQRHTRIILEYKSESGIETELLKYFENNESSGCPGIAVVNGELAYKAMTRGMIVPAENYMASDVLSGYFTGFMNEGRITGSTETYIFPVTKISELLIVNSQTWRSFLRECGAAAEDLSSWSGIEHLSEMYCKWSGGKAFMTFESVRDFVFTYSAQQLPAIIQSGNKEIKINTNKEMLRDIWDFYYNGVVCGYISQTENIPASLENGDIMCYIGIPRDSSFFPKTFTNHSGGISTLTLSFFSYPTVNTSRLISPQKGSGAVVFDNGTAANKESFAFLHWLCSNDRAVEFGAQNGEISSYKYNYSKQAVKDYMKSLMSYDYMRYNMLNVTVNQVIEGSTYAPSVFMGYDSFCDELTEWLVSAAEEGRAQVNKMMSEGVSYADAVNSVDTEAAFEDWYCFVTELAEKY